MSGMDRLTEREWLISLLTIDQEQMLTDYEVHPAVWKGDPDRTDGIAALADGILDGLARRRASQAAPAHEDADRGMLIKELSDAARWRRLPDNESHLATAVLLDRASQASPAPSEPVTLTYTNWQGKTAQRTITPVRVWFGSTPWHPEPQWLLTAVDAEKGLERDFALKDLGAPAPSDGLREAARLILSQPKRPDTLTAEAFHAACGYLDEQDGGEETTNEIIEAFLKHIAGED